MDELIEIELFDRNILLSMEVIVKIQVDHLLSLFSTLAKCRNNPLVIMVCIRHLTMELQVPWLNAIYKP